MNRSLFIAILLAAFGFSLAARSQAPLAPITPAQQLQEISRKNKLLIDSQTEMLKKLEETEQLSQQLKFMSRRT